MSSSLQNTGSADSQSFKNEKDSSEKNKQILLYVENVSST